MKVTPVKNYRTFVKGFHFFLNSVRCVITYGIDYNYDKIMGLLFSYNKLTEIVYVPNFIRTESDPHGITNSFSYKYRSG